MNPKVLYRKRTVGMIGLLAVIAVGIGLMLGMSSKTAGDKTVLTIDGYEVTECEFKAVLQNKKALTTSYFKLTYNTDYGDDFWTTSVQGENPLEYAKKLAMDELLKLKVEQIMMMEDGIVSDISYSGFLERLKAENADRKAKIKNNEPIYGPKTYGVQEYYSYLHSINFQKLVDKLTKEASDAMSEHTIQQLYDEMKQNYFHKGYSFDYEKIVMDGAHGSKEALESIQQMAATNHISVQEVAASMGETVQVESMTLNMDEASKDDILSQSLYEWFLESHEGDFSPVNQADEQFVTYRLAARHDKGYESYEDVQGAVLQIHVHGQLEEKVRQRLEEADVQVNEEILGQIAFNY